ncbi:MAG: T9SS type A sorting domain-containing protein, partial [Ignavibacteriaceae bacterium]
VTTIQFSVPQNEMVKIKVYDFLGAEIATLVNKEMNSGSYEVDFNGKTFASGIYFVRMEAGKFVETKKVVLLK